MKKKQPWQLVIKDRFLTNEKAENPFVVAFLYFIVFFMSLLLIFVVFFQLCRIIGPSMENTLVNGDHVLLYRSFSSFDHEDVVVINVGGKNASNPKNIIKRVIGLPGDTIRFVSDGDYVRVYRNGDLLDEPYIKERMLNTHFTGEYKPDGKSHVVPEGKLFVMGDNRNNSQDSRADGPYPASAVLGKMAIKIDHGSLLEFFLRFLYHEDNAPAE